MTSRTILMNFVLPALATALLVVAGISAVQSYELAVESERLSEEAYRSQNLGGQVLDKLKTFFEGKSDVEFKLASRELLRERAWHRFAAFAVLSLAGLGMAELSALRGRIALLLGLVVALGAAGLGMVTPALAMTAQQSTPVGDLAFFHESRGIWATIRQLLGRDGSLVVGVPLLLFSVVMPLAKSLLLAAVLLSGAAARRGIMEAIRRCGRWSMADVFVVAVLLAFFASSHNRFIEADVLPGIGFFAYYAVLSLPLAARIERKVVKVPAREARSI
jgi:paraquat-inducible protein A